MSSNSIIYLGYADGNGNPKAPNWKCVPNTPEAISQGITVGYTAKTILALSHEPEKGKAEPMRWGPLVMDFDSKDSPEDAIRAAKHFVTRLCMLYVLDPKGLRYWISGSKGCHIEIPAAVIGNEDGHQLLHRIYFYMVRILSEQCLSLVSGERGMIDFQMYCGGRGRLLRIENIQRSNGRYKVPVTTEEFLDMAPPDLMELTKSHRYNIPLSQQVYRCDRLASLYGDTKKIVDGVAPERLPGILEAMSKCAFLTKCVENPDTTSYPEWWVFISNLVTLGRIGRLLIHNFSRPYAGYTFDKTEQMITTAEKENKPKTCAYIKKEGLGACPSDCVMHAPCNLFNNHHAEKKDSLFVHQADGLYLHTEGMLTKVCTSIRVIGVGSGFDAWSWCRIIEITDPAGTKKSLIVSMKDFADQGAKWLGTLLDGGLILEPFQKARTLLYQYLTQTTEGIERVKVSEKIGWMDDGSYLFPDKCYGSTHTVLYSGGSETKFKVAGTLADWQREVGMYCSGNPLFMLATSFALTGPLLGLNDLEGGGLHIYGGSSKGKSTLAIVAGSVCGGGGQEGFISQWRTTDNALEKVATAHNDNLLVLDEVGQAHCTAVSKIIYMLANRQGKMRMTSDCRQRKPFVWNLNFLSTGELTMGDKIKEDGRMQPMAGQEVRVIDIPVDDGKDKNPLPELHGFDSPGQLSNHLKYSAKEFYGTPIRAFVEILTLDKLVASKAVSDKLLTFCNDNMPEGASQQVQRVLMKFALIAAAGEFAIENGIFPYRKGEANKAATKYFKIWIAQRHGLQDGEILAAIERIQSHFEACKGAYIDLADEEFSVRHGYSKRDAAGYKFVGDKEMVYFALTSTLRSLIGSANRNAALEELDKRGWLAHNSYGKILESKSICGQNVRGLGFIPSKIQ